MRNLKKEMIILESKSTSINPPEFDSEFCHICYQPEDKVVFLTWKQFCCYEDYRQPVRFALKLLQEYPGSNLVVDARNGFEDEKADAEWAFNEFIPEMAKTSCKTVTFIMNEVNDIEEEMDMWTKAFSKHFTVRKVTSYGAAFNS
jgi:hypothetical protein